MNESRILDVWSWCSEAYLRQGRKLSLPAGTNPAKTYQWRYATAIARKFEEWNLTDDAAKKFIDIAVRTAKEQGVLNKGLAVLHQSNMMTTCYSKLSAESASNAQSVNSLLYVKQWLLKKAGDRDLLEVLLERKDFDGFCNLTMWFQASRISPLYLALSRICSKALARLNRDAPEERGLLPQVTRLYLMREEFLQDQGNLRKARDIFELDWRDTCPSPS